MEFVKRQHAAIECSRALMNSLLDEVDIHRDKFQEMGMTMQVHEQYIVRSGFATQEIAQYVNMFIREK